MRLLVFLLFYVLISSPAAAAAEPDFVVRAENNYREARSAFAAAKNRLDRLEQKEAREGRSTVARNGQWIEPRRLWRKKLAAARSFAFARTEEREAFQEFNRARDAGRRMRVGTVRQPEPLTSPLWWLW